MDIDLLVKLSSRAWSMQILALLDGGRVPARQAPLLTASGAGRTAFAASLAHLQTLGLLERNPGHGHPLRPEFRLTVPAGVQAAAMAARILSTAGITPEARDTARDVPRDPSSDPSRDTAGAILLRRAWTMPVLAVTDRPRHFGEIRADLGRITDRALSTSLRQLEEQAWIRRDVDTAQRPLRPTYRAVDLGARISRTLGDAMITAP